MLNYCSNSIKHAFKTIGKQNFHTFNCFTNKNESGSDKCKQNGQTNKSKEQDSIRYNFHAECEEGLNRQINKEFYASYVYSSMAIYFDRYDVVLKGFSKLFRMAADEEILHARRFMQYMNIRGGHMVLGPIAAPERHEWDTPACAVSSSIQLEKSVIECLEALHATASQHKDLSLIDFIESEYIQEQYTALKLLGDLHTKVKGVDSKSSLLIIDLDLRKYLKSKDDWKMYNVKEL